MNGYHCFSVSDLIMHSFTRSCASLSDLTIHLNISMCMVVIDTIFTPTPTFYTFGTIYLNIHTHHCISLRATQTLNIHPILLYLRNRSIHFYLQGVLLLHTLLCNGHCCVEHSSICSSCSPLAHTFM